MDETRRARENQPREHEADECEPLIYELDLEMACPPAPLDRPPMVLIIDDDKEMLEALQVYLAGNGIDVMTTDRGAEGVRLAMRFEFDALICDMVMPNMSGEMFYLAISRVKPHLCKRFIFYTGYSGDPAMAAFLASTRQPVLPKPMGIDRLLNTIDTLAPGIKERRLSRPGAAPDAAGEDARTRE